MLWSCHGHATCEAEQAQLKAANGGLRLAYQLMSTQLYQHSKILYIATRSCWSWYSQQIQCVQSPLQGLKQTLAATQGRWHSDPHLSETVRDALLDPSSLSYMGIEPGSSVMLGRLLQLTWSILSHRAWSLAVRHHGLPECYAGLLSARADHAEQAVGQLRTNWRTLLALEQLRLTYPAAEKLWTVSPFVRSSPIRLLHVFFEAAQFRSDCRVGKHLP